jgi:hypothetical protein
MAKAKHVQSEGKWLRGTDAEAFASVAELETPHQSGTVPPTFKPMVLIGIEARPRKIGNTGAVHGVMTPAQARALARELEKRADEVERM